MLNHRRKLLSLAVIGACMVASLAHAADTIGFWHEVPQASPAQAASAARTQSVGTKSIVPSAYRVFTLDFGSLKTELNASARSIRSAQSNNFALPLPEGGTTYFTLSESNVLPAALAKRYPDIKSYKGVDDKGRRLRLDVTPQGVEATVYDDGGIWLVQRAEKLSGKISAASSAGDQYWSFRRSALPSSISTFKEPAFEQSELDALKANLKSKPAAAAAKGGSSLYTYRLAIAATSGYTKNFGGKVENGLAAVTALVNRVNEVYETDLGVHLTLIADEDKIIYTDSKTDPYAGITPGSAAMNAKNVTNLTAVIGDKQFDVGHVVAAEGDGGRADIGSTCASNKASGSTGRPDPVGDAFVVDYVAHEIGHSFGGHHPFAGCDGFAGFGAYDDVKYAAEPRSGTTVMAYAGVCGTTDLQPHSDPYFNVINIDQIQTHIAGTGGSCAVKKANTSNAAVIDSDSLKANAKSIPAKTPFALKAKAKSGNADAVLNYTWEEADTGKAEASAAALKDTGAGPIFRSFSGNTTGERVFPKLATVLGEQGLDKGEVYPATKRPLKFRVTVRDGVATSDANSSGPTTTTGDVTVNVVNTGSAFAVTAPSTAVNWKADSQQTISWNVAKTDVAPISCAKVRVDLSLDGGHVYQPTPLLASTDNNGSAKVTLPSKIASTKARFKISCTDNIFFAVSPKNATISL
ncbi:reprolysin-like metallopeptidase [Dyella silvatica]|uniref:reprolysin-like metallopeptidase n=1 Tax=Dyella silvatica TaxID=2992128 RepID=UPI0022577878|nr:zinc-dependent metalloprotease family protein [Dyella silvatica]